jgi:hypothetical protein
LVIAMDNDVERAARELEQMIAEHRSKPLRASLVERDGDPGELLHRTNWDALQDAPAYAAVPPSAEPGITAEAIGIGIGDVAFELKQELRAEIAELRRRLDDRDARDRTVAERSTRVAELQRENAVARREAERSELTREFAEYSARIERVETQLGMLLRFIGADLPRGWGNDG